VELGPYLARLALVLPALCLLIAGLLWLARRHLAPPLFGGSLVPDSGVRVSDWAALGAGHRLAIIDFAGRRLLVGVGRGGLVLLADAPRTEPDGTATGLPHPGHAPGVNLTGQPNGSRFAAALAGRMARHGL
jgi:flagellar protein FliO/FliZ